MTRRSPHTLRRLSPSVLAAGLFLLAPAPADPQGGGNWFALTLMRPVNDLVALPGGVWAATDGGVLHFDRTASRYSRHTRLDGLAEGRITTAAADESGDLWFGSSSGEISRYRAAGTRFDPPLTTFSDLSLSDLLPVGDRLYVGSDSGISVLLTDVLRVRESYWQLGRFPRSTSVTALVEHSGLLVAGTTEGVAWADLAAENLQNPDSWLNEEATGAVRALLSAGGDLLALAEDGIWRWEEGSWERELAPRGLRVLGGGGETILAATGTVVHERREAGRWPAVQSLDAPPRAIAGGAGESWVGTTAGLRSLGGPPLPDPGDPPAATFHDLATGPEGDLWAAVVPNDREGWPIGVAHLAPSGWRVHGQASGLPSDLAVALEVTEEGEVWAGTWGSGIGVRTPGGDWRRLDHSSSALRGIIASAAFVVVNDLMVDDRGLVWALNLQAGLAVFDPRTGASHLHDLESLGLPPDRRLNEVEAVGRGLLLIAADLGGVILFDDGGTPFDEGDDVALVLDSRLEPRLTADEVRTVASDGEVLYIGTPEGLFRARYRYERASESLEIVSWRSYTRAHGLLSPVVTDIELDNRGSIWVGTEGGLSRLDGSGRLVDTYTTGNSRLVDDRVLSLRFDEAGGHLWIGTRDGLGRLRLAAGRGEPDEEVRIYPNPFVSGGQARATFQGLPPGARIDLFTAGGLLVRSLEADLGGTVLWDGKNAGGSAVAPGVYYYALAPGGGGPGGRGKLAVIRGE